MSKIPWTGGTDEEYENQHFGFGLQLFKKCLRSMVTKKITAYTKYIEASVLRKLELDQTQKYAWSQYCNKIMGLQLERAIPMLDNIDMELEKLMQIPKNIVLQEDEIQIRVEQLSEDNFQKLKAEVEALNKRLDSAIKMEELLQDENEEQTLAEQDCISIRKDMEIMELIKQDLERRVSNEGIIAKIMSASKDI